MFITVEGVDGSGKTTAISRIKEELEKRGHEVLVTREPGGEPIAESIRQLILADQSEGMDAWTEALLYLAARREHLARVIIPALKANKIVISDRFMDSTSAYQGYGRGLGLEAIDQMQNQVIGKYLPDLTLYFELDQNEAQKRLAKSDKAKNRFDFEKANFKDKVREGYKKLITMYPHRIKAIDASQPLDEVVNQSVKLITEVLNENTRNSSKSN